MLTLHERALTANAAFVAKRKADPAVDAAWRAKLSRSLKRAHAKKVVWTEQAKPVLTKSNGNGHALIGRQSGLMKAMAALDKQIVVKQEELTALQAQRRLLDAATILVKQTVH